MVAEGPPPEPPTTPGWPNMDKLNAARGIEIGALYQGHNLIKTWGDADAFKTNWASCCRTWVASLWGIWISDNGLDWLGRPMRDLPCHTAYRFPSDVLVKHVQSYTSILRPPGHRWTYSNGDHWPWQNTCIGELFETTVDDACQQYLINPMGASLQAVRNREDGTLRVYGSAKEQTKLARMLLDNGWANGMQLIAGPYAERIVAGGPDGTGYPNPLEGYQTHLCKNGQAWELNMPRVPDLFMARDGSDDYNSGHGAIVGVESLNATFAYRGASPEKVFPYVFTT